MVGLHNSHALRSAWISKSFLRTVPVGRTVQFKGYPFKSLQEGVAFELYSSSHCVSLQIGSNFPGNLITSIRETTRQILFRETHVIHPENPKYATNKRCGHTTFSFNTKSCGTCTYHWADTSKKKQFKGLTPVSWYSKSDNSPITRLHSHTLGFLVPCFNISVKSRDQHAGRNNNINIGNNSSEKVEQFRYLGTTITNQNTIHEEFTSRLKSRNACNIPCWVRGLFKKYPDWNCSCCSLGGMCLQPVLTCSYMS